MIKAQTFLLICTIAYFGTVSAESAITKSFEFFENLAVSEMCAFVPANSSFLHPNSCNNWVKCASDPNAHEEGSCAVGLSYDKENGICTYAENVICPYKDAAKSKNPCADRAQGTFVADLDDCTGYILCKDFGAVRGNCPSGLVFNPKTSSCVYKNDYVCPIADFASNKSLACRSFQNNTRIADPQDCTQYHVCIDGVLKTRECLENTAYDPLKGRCVSMDTVSCFATAKLPDPVNTFCLNATGAPRWGYFRDEDSCSMYYICARPVNGKHDKEPKHLSCNFGQYFDEEKTSCRDRLNVKCSKDRCDGTSLSYVNVAGDCSKYALCQMGSTTSLGSCPADYFFDERTQGCSPQRVSYIACSA